MAITLGIIDMYWNGAQLDIEKGASIRLAGMKNNAVPVGRKLHRAQEFQGGEAKATIPFRAGDKLSDLMPGAEGELQVKCDTGQVITSPDAFILDPPTATGGEGGKRELTWNFSTYTEV
ncbi:phage tail tube protein [Acidisoma sp. 7E03]